MWGTSLLEEKLADDLGNVIEGRAESVVVSQIFLQRQIGAEQFETFSTASTDAVEKVADEVGRAVRSAFESFFRPALRPPFWQDWFSAGVQHSLHVGRH